MAERRGKAAPAGKPAGADVSPGAISRTRRRGAANLHAGDILTLLREHDIPCSIDSFAQQGWTAKLGDPAHGFYAQQGRFATIDAAASWLLAEARRHYAHVLP